MRSDQYIVTADWADNVGPIYGGQLNPTKGILTITKGHIGSYNGEELQGRWWSSLDEYAEGATPTIGAEVVYDLAEPVVYSITPQILPLLSGKNHLWADTGDITLKYKANE